MASEVISSKSGPSRYVDSVAVGAWLTDVESLAVVTVVVCFRASSDTTITNGRRGRCIVGPLRLRWRRIGRGRAGVLTSCAGICEVRSVGRLPIAPWPDIRAQLFRSRCVLPRPCLRPPQVHPAHVLYPRREHHHSLFLYHTSPDPAIGSDCPLNPCEALSTVLLCRASLMSDIDKLPR